MGKSKRWRKYGVRQFWAESTDFNAAIFGATAPRQWWAWAVWHFKGNKEGVEFSLKAAKSKADAAIDLFNTGTSR